MKILNEILALIVEHPRTGSSRVLAAALASACNTHYAVSLLDVSARLDENSMRLVARLARITQGRCEQVPDMRSCLSSGAMKKGSS